MACTDFGEDSKENVDLEGETWSVVVSGTSRVVPAGLDNGLVDVDEGRDMVVVADESWVECGMLGGPGELAGSGFEKESGIEK